MPCNTFCINSMLWEERERERETPLMTVTLHLPETTRVHDIVFRVLHYWSDSYFELLKTKLYRECLYCCFHPNTYMQHVGATWANQNYFFPHNLWILPGIPFAHMKLPLNKQLLRFSLVLYICTLMFMQLFNRKFHFTVPLARLFHDCRALNTGVSVSFIVAVDTDCRDGMKSQGKEYLWDDTQVAVYDCFEYCSLPHVVFWFQLLCIVLSSLFSLCSSQRKICVYA